MQVSSSRPSLLPTEDLSSDPNGLGLGVPPLRLQGFLRNRKLKFLALLSKEGLVHLRPRSGTEGVRDTVPYVAIGFTERDLDFVHNRDDTTKLQRTLGGKPPISRVLTLL